MTDSPASPVPYAPVSRAKPQRNYVVLGVIGFTVIGVLTIATVGLLFALLGPGFVAIGGLMALIPLGIVLFGIRWIDRWEPEPRSLLLFAFLWGAVVSVLIAIIVGLAVEAEQVAEGLSDADRELFGSVLQAPLVEELAKGLGILLIYLVARRFLDGPVDGVVYAASIAAGFAFVENILYFGGELADSGGVDEAVVGIFVVRGLMSPFAHVMFTTCTGLAIGIASTKYGVGGVIVAFFVGLVPAIMLHALWNGATYVVGDDNFFGYYFLVQVPLFIGAIVLVVQLRKREQVRTGARLAEYATAGWFSQDEAEVLASSLGRRQAMLWARQNGQAAAMKTYIAEVTQLAFARDRIRSGRGRAEAQSHEGALLQSIATHRAELHAAAAAAG